MVLFVLSGKKKPGKKLKVETAKTSSGQMRSKQHDTDLASSEQLCARTLLSLASVHVFDHNVVVYMYCVRRAQHSEWHRAKEPAGDTNHDRTLLPSTTSSTRSTTSSSTSGRGL